MDLIKQLNWRYAAKRMNGAKVPQEKIERIMEAVRLSASSMGIQPYTILVVENEELRKQLSQAGRNQPQITEASHLLVFCAWTQLTEKEVDDYINDIAATRNVGLETLADFKRGILNFVANKNSDELFAWASRQVYIALGTALTACALEEVDSTPMEGFNAAEFDRILGLPDKDMRSVVLCAIGYRDTQTDYLVDKAKVRRKREKLFVEMA